MLDSLHKRKHSAANNRVFLTVQTKMIMQQVCVVKLEKFLTFGTVGVANEDFMYKKRGVIAKQRKRNAARRFNGGTDPFGKFLDVSGLFNLIDDGEFSNVGVSDDNALFGLRFDHICHNCVPLFLMFVCRTENYGHCCP